MKHQSNSAVFDEISDARPVDEVSQSGFTLIETTVALVIILIALLGVFYTFTYAILYNAGNATRAQCLVTLQQEVELIRAAKFTPGNVDNNTPLSASCRTDGLRDLTGGVKTPCEVAAPNGGVFRVDTTVDDDPFTDGIQVDATSTIKEITISVNLAAPSPGWQTAVPATVILRRTRGN
jgi:prepilin-type N-terminal cleavage/methylation domain-containing protein